MGSAAFSLSLSLSLSLGLAAQVPSLATNDHKEAAVVPVVNPTALNAVWADCKSPGDGRIYSVGTTQVHDARETLVGTAPSFSGAPVHNRPPLFVASNPLSPIPDQARFQAVVLQAADASGAILWQVYFHGFSPQGTLHQLANNARAISVWPVIGSNGLLDEASTRIAICGETYDALLPLGVSRTSTNINNNVSSGGFVAVFDGSGELQWVQHFYYDVPVYQNGHPDSNCSITDVSIRVTETGGALTDVVTYCGVSTVGVQVAQSGLVGLVPYQEFLAPGAGGPTGATPMCATSAAIPAPAGGATDNGGPLSPRVQWDGIVGRLERAQAAGANTVQVFHSVVGGAGDDALYGIAELDEDRFVVVGSTEWKTGEVGATFPFTAQPLNSAVVCPYDVPATDFYVGTVLLFDASQSRLRLIAAHPLGATHSGAVLSQEFRATCARDVAVSIGGDVIHIVGSTDDPDFISNVAGSFAGHGFQGDLNGLSPQGPVRHTDGFLATGYVDHVNSPSSIVITGATFRGGEFDDGLTGVAVWNEHPDHVYAVGFTTSTERTEPASMQGYDLDSISVYIATDALPVNVLAIQELLRFRQFGNQATVPGSVTVPAALGFLPDVSSAPLPQHGMKRATDSIEMLTLGPVASGGICVDPRGRLNLVGAANNASVPPTLAPFAVGRSHAGFWDPVRIEIDMLPARVGRTDGTGTRWVSGALAPTVAATSTGLGGMTPLCALDPYGRRPGAVVPELLRTLVDCQLPGVGGVTDVTVIADRPVTQSTLIGGLFQVGLASSSPVILYGAEDWINGSSVLVYLFAPIADRSQRWVFPGFTSAMIGFQFSAQFVYLLSNPLTCSLNGAATPAISFDF